MAISKAPSPKGQYGGGTVSCGTAAIWEPEGDPEQGMLAKGDLKFALDGEKLHGSWVLVRMRNDNIGGKRTNWLLIKHHDEYAKEGDGEAILDEDRSVASGRAMDADRGGQGQGAKPFMLRQDGAARPMRSGIRTAAKRRDAARRRSAAKAQPLRESRKKVASHAAISSRRNSARSVDRPPGGAGWVHEIKFDGYRMQLRVEDGKATLHTRKGLDWTDKFAAIAKAAQRAARLHHRRRDRARSTTMARRISPRCRRRCRTARPTT